MRGSPCSPRLSSLRLFPFKNKDETLRIIPPALAALLALDGCSSSGLSTKNIAGAYDAAPTRGNPNTLKLVLNNDRTFLLFSRPPSATAGWQLVSQGRWTASGRTLKLQVPSKSDEKYQIQGFAESLTTGKKNAPIFIKETNVPFR